MSSSFTTSMFDSIKSALTKNTEGSNTKFKDYLKTEVGNTYTVRLLPIAWAAQFFIFQLWFLFKNLIEFFYCVLILNGIYLSYNKYS
jgi:hypothetical protein